jgi:hypothetical protein
MYTKQHGLEANLFLAPGEGEEVREEAAAAAAGAPAAPRFPVLGGGA